MQNLTKQADKNVELPSKQKFPLSNSTTLNAEAEQINTVVTQTAAP
jgi:hypothetical protein